MKNQKRQRAAKLAALKRASDRRANSFYLVVIFVGIFVCMMVTEVFYVEEEEWEEQKFLSMFSIRGYSTDGTEDIISPRLARELARVFPEEDTVFVATANNNNNNITHTANTREELALEDDDNDRWQRVPNTKDKFFVFSAYYDERRTNSVRVIAAARTRLADKVVCRFTFQNGREPFTVLAVNRLIRENWNLKYSAYFILCPIKHADIPVPNEVSVIRHGDTIPSNRLVVHRNKIKYKKPSGIAVCVKPLHYEYNKVENLIEFIEFNRLLGVSHFIFYNHTVGKEVGCILNQYVQEGIVTVLPWQLDIVSQKEIRTEGLFAALNDCLYRTMHRFEFVLMIDFDEYIIPHKNASLADMLMSLMKKNPDRTGAYSFQNAFFYLQWPNDTDSNELPYRLLILQKTIRKSKLHAHKQRSKCIVLPERVVEMGNHFVWEFIPGKAMFNIPPDVAILHHYRVCEFGGNDCINTTHVIDRRCYSWKDSLVESVALRLRLLQPVCSTILQYVKK